jgi:hypothetical protein
VEPESKDHQEKQTQGKFVPTCHYCGIIGHIRPNYYLLKSQKPWNKQDAPKKGNGEKPSSDKYVPPHRRHISQRGKDFVICENANLKFAKPVKKHSYKQIQLPTIIVVSLGTSSHTVLRSVLRNLRLRSKIQTQVSLALNLPSLIVLLGKSGNTLKGVLPHAVTVIPRF